LGRCAMLVGKSSSMAGEAEVSSAEHQHACNSDLCKNCKGASKTCAYKLTTSVTYECLVLPSGISAPSSPAQEGLPDSKVRGSHTAALVLPRLGVCPLERRVLEIITLPSRVCTFVKTAEVLKSSRRLCLLLAVLSGPSLPVDDNEGRVDRLVRKALSHASKRRDWR
jgi:hypothetical protein